MSDVKPLSAEEEAEVRSHHEPTYYPATATEPEWTQCSWSTGPDEWPCDEARLLATLDAERSARVPAPADGLREAVGAYIAWQYRQPGARRFTMTDLLRALDALDARLEAER